MSNRCRVTGEVTGAYSRAVRRGAVHTQHWPFAALPCPPGPATGPGRDEATGVRSRGSAPRGGGRSTPVGARVYGATRAHTLLDINYTRNTTQHTPHRAAGHRTIRYPRPHRCSPRSRRVITVHNTQQSRGGNGITCEGDRTGTRAAPAPPAPRVTADTRETFE